MFTGIIFSTHCLDMHLLIIFNIAQAMYDGGFVFNQLKHLKLCRCKGHSSDLLVRLLKDSSNLQALDLSEMDVSLFVKLFFLV